MKMKFNLTFYWGDGDQEEDFQIVTENDNVIEFFSYILEHYSCREMQATKDDMSTLHSIMKKISDDFDFDFNEERYRDMEDIVDLFIRYIFEDENIPYGAEGLIQSGISGTIEDITDRQGMSEDELISLVKEKLGLNVYLIK